MFFDSNENIKRLVAEAARIREEIGSSRTDTMFRLFDYLLEHSTAGYAPKELEIYHAIFAKAGTNDDVCPDCIEEFGDDDDFEDDEE